MTQLKLFGKENNQIKCTHKLLGNNNEKNQRSGQYNFD